MTEQQRAEETTGGATAAPGQPPGSASVPGSAPAAVAGRQGRPGLRPTRTGKLWVALTLGAVVLVLLLVFILENLERVRVSYFGAQGQLPLGVALLLAAVAGVLLVAIPGYGRILQLRRAARGRRR